ncbi:hypothetical protein [Actinomycetospora lemnae]|uniref:C2H2-type domain-containing protein n=1 Tax=Actinomycetospora lemnae TaxID=3019891 RepID=A0ABT5T194_9PSEU|nr:hypothetical protein [Actinomycetospora sp. DW7H6]MDD7968880.1 hypothetical protein [Actinomycetospora sp. DW7H6]
MGGIDPAELKRLRERRRWSSDTDVDEARAECAASRAGHLAVVMTEDGPPRCEHCGEILSPDALRRAGHRPERR